MRTEVPPKTRRKDNFKEKKTGGGGRGGGGGGRGKENGRATVPKIPRKKEKEMRPSQSKVGNVREGLRSLSREGRGGRVKRKSSFGGVAKKNAMGRGSA